MKLAMLFGKDSSTILIDLIPQPFSKQYSSWLSWLNHLAHCLLKMLFKLYKNYSLPWADKWINMLT